MKQSCTTITVAAILLIVGCSCAPDLQRATLRCKDTDGTAYYGFYSFTAGELTTPPADPEQVDILYYFDKDDCSQGALIGHDDRPGYLFPIGHKSWSELVMLKPPLEDVESAAAIAPLTKDKEGLAFWVKVRGGEYILVRIRAVQPASYSDIISGGTATLELEWSRPRKGPSRGPAAGQLRIESALRQNSG